MKTIIQLLPNLGLSGGTAAKVKLIAEQSSYKQIIVYAHNKKNTIYQNSWESIPNCILVNKYSLRNPIKNAFILKRLTKEYNTKLVHCYFFIDSVSIIFLKLINPHIKIIRSFEGIQRLSTIKRILSAISFKFTDHFISISKFVDNYYKNLYPQITNKSSIIYNSPAFSEIEHQPIKHDVSKRNLLTIGGLNPAKNIETLIYAIDILKRDGLNVTLDILGDGYLRNNIQDLINKLSLTDNVLLHGYTDNVKQYIDNCSLYVHPASEEGFGMSVVEAMSRYCAVIVSNSSALPEIVDNKIDGLIAETFNPLDWADKIKCLLYSQTKVDILGQRAAKKVESNFSVKHYISKVDRLYSEL